MGKACSLWYLHQKVPESWFWPYYELSKVIPLKRGYWGKIGHPWSGTVSQEKWSDCHKTKSKYINWMLDLKWGLNFYLGHYLNLEYSRSSIKFVAFKKNWVIACYVLNMIRYYEHNTMLPWAGMIHNIQCKIKLKRYCCLLLVIYSYHWHVVHHNAYGLSHEGAAVLLPGFAIIW